MEFLLKSKFDTPLQRNFNVRNTLLNNKCDCKLI